MYWRSLKKKRLREGGIGLEMRSPAGLINPNKKRRPFRGVGPEMLSPAGLVESSMVATGRAVKPTSQVGRQ